MLKNVIANCKMCDSQANGLSTSNYKRIRFLPQTYSLVAGTHFAKRYFCHLLFELTNYFQYVIAILLAVAAYCICV